MADPASLLAERVRRVVVAHAGSMRAIEPETRLHEDLRLDWIHLCDILNDLEDELHVPIPECELIDHLVTFSDLVTLAQTAVAAASAARRVA